MKALKRIKEIGKTEPRLVGLDEAHKGVIMLSPDDFELLLKAFRVMRKLLIEKVDEEAIGMESLESSIEFADSLFDKRMKE